MSRQTSSRAAKLAEVLADVPDFDAHGVCFVDRRPRDDRRQRGRLSHQAVFGDERHERQQRQQRGHREAAAEVVFVVEDLDVQRHGVGLAADVARDHRHRAELAHRAGVAQDHAVEQPPVDVGQRHVPEDLPAAGAEHDGGLLLVGALLLHQRDQLARHEREGDEDGGQHDAGHGEDDLQTLVPRPHLEVLLEKEENGEHEDASRQCQQPGVLPRAAARLRARGTDEEQGDHEERGGQQGHQVRHDRVAVLAEEGPEITLQSEDQHEHQARDHGRDGEGQVDQGDQQGPPREVETGHRPGGGDAEHDVGGEGERRHRERQPDRVPRVGIAGEVFPITGHAALEGLDEDVHDGDDDQDPDDGQR